MSIRFLFLTLLFFSASLHAQVFPVEENGKYGFKSPDGTLVKPYQYDKIDQVGVYTIVAMKMGQGEEYKWGLVNGSGKETIPVVYDELQWIDENKIVVKNVFGPIEIWGLVTASHKILLEPRFQGLRYAGKDCFMAQLNEKHGLIASDGSLLSPLKYEEISIFDDDLGLFLVKVYNQGDKFGVIKSDGTEVLPNWYDRDIQFIPEKELLIAAQGTRKSFHDLRGNQWAAADYDEIKVIDQDLIVGKSNGKISFLDYKGRRIGSQLYDAYTVLDNDRIEVVKDGKKGILDANAKELVNPKYENFTLLSKDIMLCKTEKGNILTDLQGNALFKGNITEISNFQEGFATAKIDGQWKYIDEKGHILNTWEFDKIEPFNNGLAQVYKDGKTGFIDRQGRSVIPVKYDGLEPASKGNYYASKQGKWGIISPSNSVVVAFRYEYMEDILNERKLRAKKDSLALIAIKKEVKGLSWDTNTAYTTWDGIKMNAEGEVSSIELSGEELIGVLPEELGNLDGLESLKVHGTSIYGKIPSTVGKLLKLNELSLNNNQINGLIPSSLANCPQLNYIDFSNNQLEGRIPEEMAEMPLLETFLLFGNRFTGRIPETLKSYAAESNLAFFNADLIYYGIVGESNGNKTKVKVTDILKGNGLKDDISVPKVAFESLQTESDSIGHVLVLIERKGVSRQVLKIIKPSYFGETDLVFDKVAFKKSQELLKQYYSFQGNFRNCWTAECFFVQYAEDTKISQAVSHNRYLKFFVNMIKERNYKIRK